MKILTIVFYFSVLILQTIAQNVGNPPIVQTTYGPVQGLTAQTISGLTTYNKFLGIPFAKPPVGNLRFQAPQPPNPWNTTLVCTKDTNQCTQSANPVVGQEDCLYLNVFSPADNKTRAVMFWIYGGGFNTGNASSQYYGPDYFMDYDTVFVSVNYRLGSLGFLGTEDTECAGNMGLKDQILALKWVQQNIAAFGGDPSRVTIFGQSAGSASVSYLLQMDEAAGLFSGAILESGTSLCLWALSRNARQNAFQLGQLTGVNATDTKSLIDGLRNVDYKTLQTAADGMYTAGSIGNLLTGLVWSPVNVPPESGFSGKSDQKLRSGQFHKVPIIYGVNTNEAAFIQNSFLGIIYLSLQSITYQSRTAPVDLTTNQTKLNAASIDINWEYFKFLPAAGQVHNVVRFINDGLFNRPSVRATEDSMLAPDAPPIRIYVFGYRGQLGWSFMQQSGLRLAPGAGHGEEMGYLFSPRPNTPPPSNNDIQMRNRMLTLWTNFAKFGDPTPNTTSLLQNVTWVTANTIPGNVAYLNIDLNLSVQLNPFQYAMNFWDRIYNVYGDPPYDTY